MKNSSGKIISLNISSNKGRKNPVKSVFIKKDFGILGDIHSGTVRQVSLLSWDDVVEWSNTLDKKISLDYGMFAENITVTGISFKNVSCGDRIRIINEENNLKCELEVVDIGKSCHNDCEIKVLTGNCIMPEYGIFTKVLISGEICVGDKIEIVSKL